MQFILTILLLVGLTGNVIAHQPIPWVQSVASSVISEFSPAVVYRGPTGNSSLWRTTRTSSTPTPTPTPPAPYWLEDIKHQGIAAFNPNSSSYQVFRNVKDFGAKGDGIADDTEAINLAISTGGRCAPGVCASSTTSPAIVYFPAGTYLISSSIIDYYYTQIIGNPNSLPILKATANFTGFGLIDGDPYGANGLEFGATNVFYRQVRNLVFDLTGIPSSGSATGIHWPTAQATSLQNCVFRMSDAPGTQHQGIFIEGGSGGFMNGLTFYGGLYGVVFGNQQFTVRNLTFYNAYTAINQLWDWGWTYSGISVINCSIGLNMSTGNSAAQSVDSVTLIDSTFTDTPVAILTARNSTSLPVAAGSLILENIGLVNVPVAVQGPQGTVLAGGTTTITAWGQGHEYTPNGPTSFEGPIKPNSRPQSLTIREKFYARSKPQYEAVPLLQFVSARTAGAKGDGVTDDTFALNILLWTAAAKGQIVFLDAGTYKVTSTIYIPPRSKIVGESYPVIMGSGSYFSDINNPQPIICAGSPGEFGVIEWSDTIVSTQGATAGAILIEWNLASPEGVPSGLWDVHTRIGGFAGSNLQLSQCPPTPWTTDYVDPSCIAAFMSLHIAPTASGLYLENNWFWTADHDIEDPLLTQITVFSGRGLYDSSVNGVVWLVGTAVEHHSLYQYQFANTKNIFAGQIQTETPYFQPNPDATAPFQPLERWNDPDFHKSCEGVAGNCADAWGLRIVDSQDILIYGGGLYSFFENYSTNCSNQGNGETCQTRIFSIEGSCKDIDVYNLNTVGTTHMITRDGVDVASYDDNLSGFADTIALFRIDSA